MLIQFQSTSEVQSFEELYSLTLALLDTMQEKKKTVVLGPISSTDPETVRHNLETLSFYSKKLAENGWAVLEISSFQPIVDVLLKKMNITGYPYGILHEFTLPLIRSKCFSVVHFRNNYQESLGATIEHDATLGVHIPIRYLP